MEVRIGRRRALLLAGDAELPDAQSSIRLLARYDCYVLGCYPRQSVVPKTVATRLRAHPRGRFEVAAGHWTLLIDGVVAGMWEPLEQGDQLEVRVEPFVKLTAGQKRELEREAARLGRFLGTEARLALDPLQA